MTKYREILRLRQIKKAITYRSSSSYTDDKPMHERDTDPAVETFVTGVYSPFAEGGTAFFSPRLPPLFLFARILVF